MEKKEEEEEERERGREESNQGAKNKKMINLKNSKEEVGTGCKKTDGQILMIHMPTRNYHEFRVFSFPQPTSHPFPLSAHGNTWT